MYIRVHALPGAKREELLKEKEDVWRISVREPAEQNLANERIRTLVARELSVTLSAVRILTGHHAPTKLLSIET
jgi:uncharacterized protein YggU (UPF0235/DUF167 family)